jgi:hypothetical protein
MKGEEGSQGRASRAALKILSLTKRYQLYVIKTSKEAVGHKEG